MNITFKHLTNFLGNNNITRRTLESVMTDYGFIPSMMLKFYRDQELFEDCAIIHSDAELVKLDGEYIFFVPPHAINENPNVVTLEIKEFYEETELTVFFQKLGIPDMVNVLIQEKAN